MWSVKFGRSNHIAPNCYDRYDYGYQDEDTPQAFAAMSPGDVNGQSFCIDSKVSAHMTNDTGNLICLQPSKGRNSSIVGNRHKLPISYTGDPLLTLLLES